MEKKLEPKKELPNRLYYGDCLDILRNLHKDHPDGFIDLIYIDPPFNSKRDYNILFESAELNDTKAQKEAFADTWSNISYKDTLNEIADLDVSLFNFLTALESANVPHSAISYLTTMAIRIFYMRKVLKDSGSFYLHCDPTMSHYLKIVCDMIFGAKNFRNEIIWKRTYAKGLAFTRFASDHDIIFYYAKSKSFTWNPQYKEYNEEYLRKFYRYTEEGTGRKYQLTDLTNPNKNRPNLTYEFLGINRVWRWTRERMQEAYEKGLVIQTTPDAVPRFKRYLDEQEGNPVDDIWIDIAPAPIGESLGYPTQKPEELLKRIIEASSNEGDLVADFFCGCGTTIAAAITLKRHWIGIDISHLAIGLIEKKRLIEPFIGADEKIKPKYEVFGFPRDLDGAKQLAQNVSGGRLKFEQWIVEAKLNAVLNDVKNKMGHDGYTTFELGKEKHIVLIEVKSGGATVSQLNHFIKTVDTRKAHMGVFVCFKEEVTKNMLSAAKDEGYFKKEIFGNAYDKIQILTVEDILDNKGIKMPDTRNQVFKTSKKKKSKDGEQLTLDTE